MTKKSIFNLIIVDASGSMSGKEPEVTGGINQIFSSLMEDEIKDPDIKNAITVTDFSSHGDFTVLLKNKQPSELRMLVKGDYTTRGMTALYDAIGKSFLLVPEGYDGVFVTIFTDGLENDSKEFKARDIRRLINEKQTSGWVISFMGTSQEAMIEAEHIGIKSSNSLFYEDTKAGTAYAFDEMYTSRKKYTEAFKKGEAVSDLFDKDMDKTDF